MSAGSIPRERIIDSDVVFASMDYVKKWEITGNKNDIQNVIIIFKNGTEIKTGLHPKCIEYYENALSSGPLSRFSTN